MLLFITTCICLHRNSDVLIVDPFHHRFLVRREIQLVPLHKGLQFRRLLDFIFLIGQVLPSGADPSRTVRLVGLLLM